VRRRFIATLALAGGLSLAAGCDSDTADPGDCNIQPRLSSVASQYFAPGCVFDGCHTTRSSEGGLDLEAAGLHARLVNVPAQDANAAARGKLLVVPGDPDASFLLQKVEGRMEADEGELMPDGATEPIDPDCRIRMLREWIVRGAPND